MLRIKQVVVHEQSRCVHRRKYLAGLVKPIAALWCRLSTCAGMIADTLLLGYSKKKPACDARIVPLRV